MDHFAGLDVSVKETSVCILDDAGKILKEVKVASEPLALLKVLGNPTYCFKRIGLEAGPLSPRDYPMQLPGAVSVVRVLLQQVSLASGARFPANFHLHPSSRIPNHCLCRNRCPPDHARHQPLLDGAQ